MELATADGARHRALTSLEPLWAGSSGSRLRCGRPLAHHEGAPPRPVPAADLTVRLAASVPRIITYASPEMVSTAVKVLTIGGKAPSDPGYPLSL